MSYTEISDALIEFLELAGDPIDTVELKVGANLYQVTRKHLRKFVDYFQSNLDQTIYFVNPIGE